MKTTKLVIGIISIVLFLIIAFQSCFAGLGNAISGNGESSGSAGFFLATCMLVAGIVGICTRKGFAGGIVSGCFYAIGGLIGIANYGTYSDLKIWSILSFIFAFVYIAGTIITKKKSTPKSDNGTSED